MGAHAALVEQSLNIPGERILYVGDHIYSDVKASKNLHRWRTALIMRELEAEIDALREFEPKQAELSFKMARKEEMEAEYSALRLELQRKQKSYGPQTARTFPELEQMMGDLKKRIVALDEEIAPLAVDASSMHNPNWGLLMQAGNEKSHFARQVERSADLYTSRVSNFLAYTPFVYLRSFRGSLPHNPIDMSDYNGLIRSPYGVI